MIDLADPQLFPQDVEYLLWNADSVNRFGGRGRGEVSILRHSLLVESICVTPPAKTLAILHDLHEVPYGEITTPAKHVIGYEIIKKVTDRFDESMFRALGVSFAKHTVSEVKKADVRAMMTEKEFLGIDLGDDWGTGVRANMADLHRFDRIMCMSKSAAIDLALRRIPGVFRYE